MKLLTTITLAAAFALTSKFALAYTTHHKYRTHHGTTYRGTVGMGYGQYGRGGSTVGIPAGGWTAPRYASCDRYEQCEPNRPDAR